MSILSHTLAVVAGAAVGCGTTYVACRKYFSDKAEREIAEAREHYKSILEAKQDEEPDEEEQPKEEVIVKDSLGEYVREASSYTNYNGVVTSSKGAESVSNSLKHVINNITSDEYYNSEQNYDKVTLTYYTENEELIDEDGAELQVEDPFASYFEDYLDDDFNILYGRDDTMRVDYEFIIERRFEE